MLKITIRPQKVSDAKRFFEILNNPNFIFFPVRPKSVKAEKEWLKNEKKRRKNRFAWSYTILCNRQVIGAVGIGLDQHRKYIGEIVYFVDEAYWNQGVATRAVKLAEKVGFSRLKLTRIEVIMSPRNKSSEKVAVKCGYKKEGLMKKAITCIGGKKIDAWLYAKVKL
jgi:ribosomal-protein-alanine N-acetyltransferase